MSKRTRTILLGVLAVLIIMQFIRIDKTNPETDPSKDLLTLLNPPAEIAQMIKVSCNDCHSHHTVYPWYTNIAPFSYWIKHHINEGREHLNFSVWEDYNNKRAHHKLEECYEEVLEGHMPLPSYLWMHGEAKLDSDQQKKLAGWFESQMSKYTE